MTQNFVQAIHWYEKAVALDEPMAAYRLGRLYEYGQGLTVNKTEAKRLYQFAIEQGYEEVKAQLEQLPK